MFILSVSSGSTSVFGGVVNLSSFGLKARVVEAKITRFTFALSASGGRKSKSSTEALFIEGPINSGLNYAVLLSNIPSLMT